MDNDQAKKIIRRLENVENVLNRIFKDRNVIEDTYTRIGTLTDQVMQVKERVEKLEKRLSADIKDVTEKLDETNDILNP